MGDLTVAAHAGESLDELVWRRTGGGAVALEAVLAANAGLAALGPRLPLGTLVTIPATAPTTDTLPLVNLWD